MQRNVRVLRYILWACVLGTGLFVIGDSMLRSEYRQGDFHTYYTAAQTWAQGESPYVIENLRETAGAPIRFSFTYPPVLLPFFRLFTYLPFATAARVWVMLKLCALAGLIWVWRKHFIPEIDPLLLALLLVFGFNHALPKDFLGGNVTVIIQAILWSGLALILSSRLVAGAVMVGVASIFKFTPLIFLAFPVLIAPRDRRSWLALAVGCAVFITLILAPLVLSPNSLQDYVSQFRTETAGGGPSKWQPFGLFVVASVMSEALPHGAPPWASMAIWSLFLGGIGLLSRKPLADAYIRGNDRDLLMYIVVLYAIAFLPPKPYVLMVLTVPVLSVFLRFFREIGSGAALALLLFSVQSSTDWPAGLGLLFRDHFLPWTVTVLVWSVFCLLYDQHSWEADPALRDPGRIG